MGTAWLTSNTRLCRPGELPVIPTRSRILVQPDRPADTTEGGLAVPEEAQHRPYSGKILAAGLQALDVMRDNGINIGDSCWLSKFGGVREEFDRVTDGPWECKSPDGHSWSRRPSPGADIHAWECELCGAKRIKEPITMADVDDILGVVEHAKETHAGTMKVVTKNTDNGIQHFYERKAS